MWVRKSEDEIQEHVNQEEAKRKSLLRPFLFALGLTVVAVILYSLGYRGGWLRGGMVLVTNPSGFNARLLFIGGGLFAFFFALALYNQRIGFFSSSNDNVLCRECKEPSHATPSGMCECGGILEPFGFFNWVEDEKAH